MKYTRLIYNSGNVYSLDEISIENNETLDPQAILEHGPIAVLLPINGLQRPNRVDAMTDCNLYSGGCPIIITNISITATSVDPHTGPLSLRCYSDGFVIEAEGTEYPLVEYGTHEGILLAYYTIQELNGNISTHETYDVYPDVIVYYYYAQSGNRYYVLAQSSNGTKIVYNESIPRAASFRVSFPYINFTKAMVTSGYSAEWMPGSFTIGADVSKAVYFIGTGETTVTSDAAIDVSDVIDTINSTLKTVEDNSTKFVSR